MTTKHRAEELADKFQSAYTTKYYDEMQEVATLLLQQQAEIEALKEVRWELTAKVIAQQVEIEELKESLTEAQQESLNWENKHRSIT